MGRLVRRFIRAYSIRAVNQVYVAKAQALTETVNLTGVRSSVTINDAVTVTGYSYGVHIEQNILGTGVVTSFWEGIRLEMYTAAGATAYATYGMFMSNYNLGTTGDYYFLRLQENGTATVTTALYIRVGTGNITYCFWLHGDTNAWAALGAPSVQSGWIRCMVGGLVRYIRLYATAP